eukprot:COSAG06_NODE_21617_length_749_cov_0.578221_2_plen_214_part_01
MPYRKERRWRTQRQPLPQRVRDPALPYRVNTRIRNCALSQVARPCRHRSLLQRRRTCVGRLSAEHRAPRDEAQALQHQLRWASGGDVFRLLAAAAAISSISTAFGLSASRASPTKRASTASARARCSSTFNRTRARSARSAKSALTCARSSCAASGSGSLRLRFSQKNCPYGRRGRRNPIAAAAAAEGKNQKTKIRHSCYYHHCPSSRVAAFKR